MNARQRMGVLVVLMLMACAKKAPVGGLCKLDDECEAGHCCTSATPSYCLARAECDFKAFCASRNCAVGTRCCSDGSCVPYGAECAGGSVVDDCRLSGKCDGVCCPSGACVVSENQCVASADLGRTGGRTDLATSSNPDLSTTGPAFAKLGEITVQINDLGDVAVEARFFYITSAITMTVDSDTTQGGCQVTTGAVGTASAVSNQSAGDLTVSGPGGSLVIAPAGDFTYADMTDMPIADVGQVITAAWSGATVPAAQGSFTRVADSKLGCTLTDGMNVSRTSGFSCPINGSGGDLYFEFMQVAAGRYRRALCRFAPTPLLNASVPSAALSGFAPGPAELTVQLNSSQDVVVGEWQVRAAWLGKVFKSPGLEQPPIGINFQ